MKGWMLTVLTGNNFTMYVSQFIVLFTLNLYSGVCQLYLNKTWWGADLGIRGWGGIRNLSLKKTNSGHLRQVAPVHTSGSIGENPYPF